MTLPTRVGRSPMGFPFRSPLGVLGLSPGRKLLGANDVAMEWSVVFVQHDTDSDTILATVPGTVQFHDRMFWVLFHLLGTPNNRGSCSIGTMNTQAFSGGTIDPVNDLNDSNSLALISGSDVVVSTFKWNGHPSIAGDGGAQVSLLDTGTAVDLRANVTIVPITAGPHSVEGFYFYDPNVLLGAPHTVFDVQNWILGYFKGAGGLDVGLSPTIRVIAKITCKVTV